MNGAWSSLQLSIAVGIGVLLFVLECVFSVTIAAASSVSRVTLRRLSAEGPGRLGCLETLREPLSSHRTSTQVARQLCLLGGTLAFVLAAHGAGWRYATLSGVLVAAVLGVLLLELVVARVMAAWDPRAALRRTAPFVRLAHAVLFPIVGPAHRLLGTIARPVTEEERDEEQEEEVEAFIEVGERDGILEANEGEMMRSIVDLDETVVREIMTPRPDIVALSVDATVEQARRMFLDSGHSRLPVYRQSVDEIVGVLHVRDLLRATVEGDGDQPISGVFREPTFVPETRSVATLLAEMRLKAQLAVVVDEYGGTAGLVTIEDLVEEIVGEIRDEHDQEAVLLHEERDGSWTINAAAHVEQLEEIFDVQLGERDFDTVGGLVVSELGRVPQRGDSLQFQSIRIDVLSVEGRRIGEVRVRRVDASNKTRAEG